MHCVIHRAQPLLVGLGVLGGVEAKLQVVGLAALGAHGDGHQGQAFHFIGVVQGVLQGDAGAEGEAAEHQIPVDALSVEPSAQPVGVAFHAAARRAVQVSGQMGSQTAGVMGQLVHVGIGAAAGARAVNEYQLSHLMGTSPSENFV